MVVLVLGNARHPVPAPPVHRADIWGWVWQGLGPKKIADLSWVLCEFGFAGERIKQDLEFEVWGADFGLEIRYLQTANKVTTIDNYSHHTDYDATSGYMCTCRESYCHIH